MLISIPWSSTAYGSQLAIDDNITPNIKIRGKANGSWGDWSQFLLNSNYTNYTVKKDGTGASGTWGIDISGNAATATAATKADSATRATTAGSADSILWKNISGKPGSFPPSAHTHSEYANQNAFSNIKINSGTTPIAATSPTDTFNLIAGDNIIITNNEKNITIGSKNINATYDLSAVETTPTKKTYLQLTPTSGLYSGVYIEGTGATTVTVESNDRIIINSTDTNTTYSEGVGISISGTTISNSGVRLIASGSTNGTISVNTGGATADVKVKGLGSAAYTNSSDYQSVVTGAATTIIGSNLTANRALISNASGKVVVSSVSNTELGYLSGVTSAIQTQLDNKPGKIVKTTIGSNTNIGEIFNGLSNTASGAFSHAEGASSTASGDFSHAEGSSSTASGGWSHAEGYYTIASESCSHAEGNASKALAENSHAEGLNTKASGKCSHVEGLNTEASGDYSHVMGKWNIGDPNSTYAFIIGNGTASARSNAFAVDWGGGIWITDSELETAYNALA